MKFAALAALVSAAAVVSAQNSTNGTDYASGLLQALQGANLTTLGSLATANAATLLPLLQSGNHTIFAPSDSAFAALPSNVTSDQSLVANTLLYHILSGSYAPQNLSTNHTIARTALNTTGYVRLPSNASQVAVLTRGEGGNNQSATVVQAASNVTSVGYTKYQNLDVYIIDEVLTIPGNLTATAAEAGLTSLVGALQTYAPQAATALDSARGLTLFAPVNSAFEAAASLIGQLNQTSIANVLLNHIINGTVVYSPLISNGSVATSAGGENISFITNSTGVFVRSANTTARIVRTDIPVANGVVHLIDQILANPSSDPQAAASAASSAASVAATQTAQQTGQVTPTASGSSSRPSASGTSSADKVVVGGLTGLIALGVAALF